MCIRDSCCDVHTSAACSAAIVAPASGQPQPAPCVCVVAKAWEEQCEKVLGVDGDENLAMVAESVAFLRRNGKEVIVDCEHFFDGHAAGASFAIPDAFSLDDLASLSRKVRDERAARSASRRSGG